MRLNTWNNGAGTLASLDRTTGSNPVSGLFVDNTISFNTVGGNNSTAVGEHLLIVLGNDGTGEPGYQVVWDNVRLSDVGVPEPSSLSLIGLGCLVLFRPLRRRGK